MNLSGSIEAKLQSQVLYEKVEALEQIAQTIATGQDPLFINSIALKLADILVHRDSTNKFRLHIVKDVVQKCHSLLAKHVINKEEFLSRVSMQLTSNDPQSRIITLKLLSYLPTFLQTKLEVQHQILHLLTTTRDDQERLIANETISRISGESELFAKSIMTKVEESVLSSQYSIDTCCHLINAIANVSGEAITALTFFQTIKRVYESYQSSALDSTLLRALLRMTIKAPILLDQTLEFLLENGSIEGIAILSAKYQIEEMVLWHLASTCVTSDRELGFFIQILANQYYKGYSIDGQLRTQTKTLVKSYPMLIQQTATADLSDRKSQNQLMFMIYLDQDLATQLNQLTLGILYCAVLEHPRLRRLYKSLSQLIQTLIDITSLTYDTELGIKALFYMSQSIQQLEISEILIHIALQLENNTVLKIKTFNNFFTTFIDKMNIPVVLDFLLTSHDYDLLIEVISRYLNTKPYYQHLQYYFSRVLDLAFIQEKSLVSQYMTVVMRFVNLIAHVCNDIEASLIDSQKLSQEVVALLDRVNFKGKEMFELKDRVQNDESDDPYKHYFIYNYSQMLIMILELMLFSQICREEHSPMEDVESMMIAQIKSHLAYISKVHGETLINGEITMENLSYIFWSIPTRLFKLRIPLFANILLNEDQGLKQSEQISVPVNQDYLLNVKLEIPKSKRVIKCVHVSTYLIQYHGIQFNMESSDIVSQQNFIVKPESPSIQTMLKFPTIGTYLLRVEARLQSTDKVIGIDTKRHLMFKVK